MSLQEKSKTKKSGEEESDSDSDRVFVTVSPTVPFIYHISGMLPTFPLLTRTNLLLDPLLPIHNRMDKEGILEEEIQEGMEEGMKEEVMEEEEEEGRREAIMPIPWLHPSVVLQLMEELLLLLLPLPLLRKLEEQGLQVLQQEVQLLELLLVSHPLPNYRNRLLH